MTIVKSLSVGDGDMFYVRHNSDNFTMIDCCMSDDDRSAIVSELKTAMNGKGIVRFISTHPDNDHICGLKHLDDEIGLINFYCVANSATKPDDTDDFDRYCELRDSDKKAFHIFKGCQRRWMNQSNDERGGAGINILWPIIANEHYQAALADAAKGKSFNNISPIIRYSQEGGVNILWMGDMESAFMESISDAISLPRVDILFAPHHGRDSGKVPQAWLDHLAPKLVIVGEAPAQHLNYYAGYDTITQNSAGDITFECIGSDVHIYVSSSSYVAGFLTNKNEPNRYDYYLGTLKI